MINRIVSGIVLAFAFSALPAAAAAPDKGVDVTIRTTAGQIVVHLETAKAPVTTRNFLKYVDGHLYDNASFYRVLPPDSSGPANAPGVIQGGLGPSGTHRLPSIPVESTKTTGLHNTSGAIAMARTNDPNSANSEFFICVGDDSYLDGQNSQDGVGYAVFGKVVKGYDVVLKIQHSPSIGDQLHPPVKILSIRRNH